MVRIVRYVIALAILAAAALPAHAALQKSAHLLISAQLKGADEVPSVTTDARGVAALSISPGSHALYLSLHVTGLSGPVTGAHIHDGMSGVNGPVLIGLPELMSGGSLTTQINMNDVPPGTLAKLLSGQTYINVHTAAHPDGEIRGQLTVETDMQFQVMLSGTNEVPSVATDGYGLGVFTLSPDHSILKLHVTVQNLSSEITGAHLHIGSSGENGNVVADLSALVDNNTIVSEVHTNTFLDALMSGNVYLNIHTIQHPDGEIRGQLTAMPGIYFDAMLDGNQEVPAVSMLGTGMAGLHLNPTMDTLSYNLVLNGLSGPAQGAHFHAAGMGSNGSVVVNLSNNINGNNISGIVTGTDLTPHLLADMLSGNIYVNVHTAQFPDGEIRGQIYPLVRKGYIFTANGGQEVAPVAVQATGGGVVSIDRDGNNAHYMIVVSDLSGPIVGAHFHNGKPGTNGPVIFDLASSFANNAASGYWTAESSNPFTTDIADLFARSEVYFNVHTPSHPSGEIRGNITQPGSFLEGELPDFHAQGDILFTARMNGQAEVPSVLTTGQGIASIHMSPDRDSLVILMTVSGLTGPITGAHIHQGKPGENGSVNLSLTEELNGNSLRMVLTGNNNMTNLLLLLLAGDAYINVHTALHPDGEIRGQFMMEADYAFSADLDGSKQIPEVTTGAYGVGSFILGLDQQNLSANVQVHGLTGPITGAHLHMGSASTNGNVVIDLMPYVQGTSIRVDLNISASLETGFGVDQFLQQLMNGNIYVNIHTAEYPNGEIRSQLMAHASMYADARLSGGQETPPAVGSGSGVATFRLKDFATVEYSVVVDGLTGPITGAHLHIGAPGASGMAVVDLMPDVEGNRIAGEFSMVFTSPPLLEQLLQGNAYINIHTAAYPDGEIRGQILPTLRDGYAFELCGKQEVPIVETMFRGTAVVSVDRNNSSLHFMMVNDIPLAATTITGAHFHKGTAGTNGEVLFDLTPLLNAGAAYGFWSSPEPTMPLSKELIQMLRDGELYLNVHSIANIDGVIRGQVVKNNTCESITTGVEETTSLQGVQLYPVPVADMVTLSIHADAFFNGKLVVRDLLGRTLLSNEVQVREGSNSFRLDLSALAAGSYIVSIENGASLVTARSFVKQ